ncbi:LOW QUALITY PROTEIN: cytochrome P450 2W1-like [Guaruba guarouba]
MGEISEKPGPVFTFHLGFRKVVVLTGYKTVKDALLNTGDMFADRPPVPILCHIQHGKELWKTTQQFTIAAMWDLDMGKHLGEERMLEELRFLIELIKSVKELNKSDTLFHGGLLTSALDLLVAVTETTSTTLQWAILLLLKYPEIKKVHAEIERVLGPSCLPTFEDQKKMPFTNAVIHHVQRFVTLLPHVPQCTSVDTHFKDYFIPKGTAVIPLLTSVLLDKTQWETPDEFNTNHFLDVDGNFIKKKAFLPFYTGQRNCIGERLATMELFIFFTGLMQKLIFKPLPGIEEYELDTTAEAGFTMRLQPQCVCAVLCQ